ncbi:MAG: winged helix-turn-helix transcriptional regulator, partial [Candidatus Aureabacteria bacterium]|nr:winged helix-turn-helix transcriptional regulator [Candidatus Auribacterota bacterium]
MKKRELFKIFSSDVRLKIFRMLLNDRMCVSKIVENLDVTQPTVTQHLKMLERCGLVKSEKIGFWVHYS